jgi:hypothetical protein
MHAYIRALVEVLPLAPDVFAPSCLFELAVLFNRGNDQALEGRSYLLLLALYYVVIKLVIMINGACIGLNVLIFSNYTHATSRCFVRHKLEKHPYVATIEKGMTINSCCALLCLSSECLTKYLEVTWV